MQLLPALASSPNVVTREAPAGRHLPYSHHVDANTIATRDGLLMQVIALRGLLFETADTDEINRSEEHTSELQSLMRISYAVFCLKKKKMNRTYRIYLYSYTTIASANIYIHDNSNTSNHTTRKHVTKI